MMFRSRKPLLHAACERGAWKCTEFLVMERSEEIHMLKDEYYPIHYAVWHDNKFLELLIKAGADTTVRTCTQQMTLLHVGKFEFDPLLLQYNDYYCNITIKFSNKNYLLIFYYF